MPWIELKKFNGKEFVSILFDNPHQKIFKEWREVKYVEITDEQSKLPLGILRDSYNSSQKKTEEKRHKFAKLLEEVIGYIKTSHHKGERENAKDLYLKITGHKYTGPEYQS